MVPQHGETAPWLQHASTVSALGQASHTVRMLMPRGENQAEEESREQPAQMRGHADLRRRKIERDLNGNDQRNIREPLFSKWRVLISQ